MWFEICGFVGFDADLDLGVRIDRDFDFTLEDLEDLDKHKHVFVSVCHGEERRSALGEHLLGHNLLVIVRFFVLWSWS